MPKRDFWLHFGRNSHYSNSREDKKASNDANRRRTAHNKAAGEQVDLPPSNDHTPRREPAEPHYKAEQWGVVPATLQHMPGAPKLPYRSRKPLSRGDSSSILLSNDVVFSGGDSPSAPNPPVGRSDSLTVDDSAMRIGRAGRSSVAKNNGRVSSRGSPTKVNRQDRNERGTQVSQTAILSSTSIDSAERSRDSATKDKRISPGNPAEGVVPRVTAVTSSDVSKLEPGPIYENTWLCHSSDAVYPTPSRLGIGAIGQGNGNLGEYETNDQVRQHACPEMDSIYRFLKEMHEEHSTINFGVEFAETYTPTDVKVAVTNLAVDWKSNFQNYRELLETYRALPTDYKELRTTNMDLVEEEGRLTREIAKLEKENAKKELLHTQIKQKLDQRITELEDEKNLLSQRSTDSETLINNLREELRALSIKLSMLEMSKATELSFLKGKIAGIEIERQNQEDRLCTLQTEFALEKAARESQTEHLSKATASLERVQSENIAYQTKNNDLTNANSALEHLMTSGANELYMAQQRIEVEKEATLTVEMAKNESDKQLRELTDSMATMSHQWEMQKRQLLSNHATEQSESRKIFQAEKVRLEQECKRVEAASATQYIGLQNEIERAKSHSDAQYRDLQSAQAEEMRIAQENFDNKLRQLSNQMSTLRTEHDDEIAVIKAAHDRDKKTETKNLREKIEQLKGALVQKDLFKSLTDRELREGFRAISNEIDGISRVVWSQRKRDSWPIAESTFRNVEHDRRPKLHIIQNTLWVILYEKILCTPFRVLGNEGKLLETQWLNIFGQDQEFTLQWAPCPRPTKESERWRYEKMRLYADKTKIHLCEGEADIGIYEGFQSSMKETIDEISRELDKVAETSSSQIQRIGNVVKKTAEFWLGIGQQPFRIFLLMTKSANAPARSRPENAQGNKTLNLVVVPELRRIGNAHGDRLDQEDVVSDCKGEFTTFLIN